MSATYPPKWIRQRDKFVTYGGFTTHPNRTSMGIKDLVIYCKISQLPLPVGITHLYSELPRYNRRLETTSIVYDYYQSPSEIDYWILNELRGEWRHSHFS